MDKKELYNSINQHLASIDDSLKTMAWVQSATLSMNEENMKKLNDTTTKMISSFGALSRSDYNSEDDTNDVPSDALVYSNAEDALPYNNDIKRERKGE